MAPPTMAEGSLVSAGYDRYYGFREPPFSLTPDPRFAFSAESHERALQTIVHALGRREGLIVVTGDIGCGKTTLCQRLLPLLPPRAFLSMVLNPFLTGDDLLKQVLEDFGLVSAEEVRRGALAKASAHELARTLHDFLNSLGQINGAAVVIVDEAQNLPLRTLEQIRLLSNFETHNTKLLQIILVGQRNLEPILELEELRQLNQRVSRRCRIEPLKPHEVTAYVNHRLSAASDAGVPQVRFTTGALGAVAKLSGGVPRVINLICDRALEIGRTREVALIDRRLIVDAARDLELPVSPTLRLTPAVSRQMWRGAAAAAIAIAAVAGALAVRGMQLGQTRPASAAPAVEAEVAGSGASQPESSAEVAYQPMEAAAPPPTAIVQSAETYELTVASFETAGRAKGVAANLIERGHPARVASSSSGRWQVVIVGPYTTLAEANEAKATLEQNGFSAIRVNRTR